MKLPSPQDVVALDIETVCDVKGCPGHGDYKKCDHALDPWRSKITTIGVWHPNFDHVFRSVEEFNSYNAIYDHNYVGHNFKFDYLHLRAHGVELREEQFAACTKLMAFVSTKKISQGWLYAYNAKRPKSSRPGSLHSLKTLAPFFLGVDPYWEVDDKDDDDYVLKDCRYTHGLYDYFHSKFSDDEKSFYQERLLPWTKMLLGAEERGVQLDLNKFEETYTALAKKRDELQDQLDEHWARAAEAWFRKHSRDLHDKYKLMCDKALLKAKDPEKTKKRYADLHSSALEKLPRTLNYDSPTQMLWLLRDFLRYDVQDLDGKDSTGKEVLQRLASQGHEDVATFYEWRKAKKLLEYLDSYKELAVDGVIHCDYNPTGTRTGRLSSSKPNLQQVNKKLKPIFRARDGYKFIGYDLSSIEAKLIAYYTEDTTLYDIVAKDRSMHDHNVKVFFQYDTPIDEVKEAHPVERQATKNCGFALFYGAGGNRIRQTFAAKGFMFDQERCYDLLGNYKNAYPEVFKFHRDITELFESGEDVLNLFGRPLKIQDKRDSYMKGFNSLIQSSGSDLNLESARKALATMSERGIEAHLLLLVHDFIGIEVEDGKELEAEEILVDAMTNYDLATSHGPIKLGCEGYVSDRWDD